MKKIFISFVALAAIAACSKTEVQYENSGEIAFAPAVKNITKAAISGEYPDQPLRVFANYGVLEPETEVTSVNINQFGTPFLNNWKSPVCVTPEAQVPLTLESKFRMTPIKS